MKRFERLVIALVFASGFLAGRGLPAGEAQAETGWVDLFSGDSLDGGCFISAETEPRTTEPLR